MTSLTQSWALTVGSVYRYDSVLNDRNRRAAEKCGFNLWMAKSKGRGLHQTEHFSEFC